MCFSLLSIQRGRHAGITPAIPPRRSPRADPARPASAELAAPVVPAATAAGVPHFGAGARPREQAARETPRASTRPTTTLRAARRVGIGCRPCVTSSPLPSGPPERPPDATAPAGEPHLARRAPSPDPLVSMPRARDERKTYTYHAHDQSPPAHRITPPAGSGRALPENLVAVSGTIHVTARKLDCSGAPATSRRPPRPCSTQAQHPRRP